MKTNQRTIKVYDSTHKLAARLSDRFHVSMSALIELLVLKAEQLDTLEIPARDPRCRKSNSRRVLGRTA